MADDVDEFAFHEGDSHDDVVVPKFKFSDDSPNAGDQQHAHNKLQPLEQLGHETTYDRRRPVPFSDGPNHSRLSTYSPLQLPSSEPVSCESYSNGGRRLRNTGYDPARDEYPYRSLGPDPYRASEFYEHGLRQRLSQLYQMRLEEQAQHGEEDDTHEIEYQQLLRHQAYIAKKQRIWKLEDAKGVYFVKCDRVSEQWPQFEGSGGFSMIIMEERDHPGRLIAEFDLGVVTGLMRFTLPGEDQLENGDSDGEDKDAAKEEKKAFYENFVLSSSKRNANPTEALPAAKKTRSEPTTGIAPLKLLLTWRGRDACSGELQVDTDSNIGVIQFSDTRLLSFVGRIRFDILGSPVEIDGFKIADLPAGKQPSLQWSEFSWVAQERALAASRH